MIAAYGDPTPLGVAIRSVLLQSLAADEIIVVGDCTDYRANALISSIEKPGIRFLNLRRRSGSQSLPNAVGAVVAKSRFVAFLNQDDLWLPHHLELALSQMHREKTSWFRGATAFCDRVQDDRVWRIPKFDSRSDPLFSTHSAFMKGHSYVEPASAYVFKRAALLAQGNWRPPWELVRSPLSELAIRLGRHLGEPSVGNELSVAKINGPRPTDGVPLYERAYDIHRYLDNHIKTENEQWPASFDWPQNGPVSRMKQFWALENHPKRSALMNYLGRGYRIVYRLTGVDLSEQIAWGNIFRKGELLEKALRVRTNESVPSRYTLCLALRDLGIEPDLSDQQGHKGSQFIRSRARKTTKPI